MEVLHETLQSVACNIELGLNVNKVASGRLIQKTHSLFGTQVEQESCNQHYRGILIDWYLVVG